MSEDFIKDINKILDFHLPLYTVSSIPINPFLFHFLAIKGIYIFYSKKEIFYIGASINIGSRLKAHFSKESSYKKKIKKIEIIRLRSTDNPCGVEAHLIDKFSPPLNKDHPSSCFFPFPPDLNLIEVEQQIKKQLGIK